MFCEPIRHDLRTLCRRGRAPVVAESFVTGDDKAILAPAHVPGVIEDWSSRGAPVGYRCVGPPRPPGRQSTLLHFPKVNSLPLAAQRPSTPLASVKDTRVRIPVLYRHPRSK